MHEYSDIVQFARDLCLLNTDIIVFPDNEEPLEPTDFILSANYTLNLFRDAFCDRFHKVYKKSNSVVLDTEEQFFIYTIPRCLKLVTDVVTFEYYFSFMLVAAFIQELVYFLEKERDCYRFSGTAYKCLVAVFKRRFEEFLDENGGWRGLENFIDKYEDPSFQKKHKRLANVLTSGNYAHTRRVLQLIKECDTDQNECFSLDDYERSLIALDDELSIDAEINKSFVKSGVSSIPLVRDTEKNKEGSSSASKSVTPKKGKRSLSKSPSPFKSPKEIEPLSDSDSSWESSDSESSDSYPASGREKLEGLKSKVTVYTKLSKRLLQKRPSGYEASSESSDLEPSSSDFAIGFSRFSRLGYAELQKRKEYLGLNFPKFKSETLSERLCKRCNKICYEYARYFLRKHRESFLIPDYCSKSIAP